MELGSFYLLPHDLLFDKSHDFTLNCVFKNCDYFSVIFSQPSSLYNVIESENIEVCQSRHSNKVLSDESLVSNIKWPTFFYI